MIDAKGTLTITHSSGRTHRLRMEYLFLLLYVPLSLLMMAAMPIFRVADEPAHLQRAYLISTGHILPTGDTLYEPDNLLRGHGASMTHNRQRAMAHEVCSETLVPSSAGFNTGIYPPISYFPQAAGMALVRLFTNNRLAMLFGARIGAWLVTTLLLFLAIRWLPCGKWVMLSISLLPMLLSESISASADGLAIGAVAALLGYVLMLRQKRRRIGLRQGSLLLLLCLCVIALKLLYCPLVVVVFFLPEGCFASRRQRLATLWGVPVVSAALVLGWMALCYLTYVAGSTAAMGSGSVSTIVPQLLYVVQHPLQYAVTLLRSLAQQLPILCVQLFGSSLGALDLLMPLPLILAVVLLTLGVWCMDSSLPTWRVPAWRRIRIALLGMVVLSVLVSYTALYVWWSPYQSPIIYGFQGRYLLPLMLPLFLGVRPAWQLPHRVRTAGLPLMVGLLTVCALASIHQVYVLTA